MKYLPLRDLENVTSALNFSTADCHVIGGCDLYITKAAGGDKKLYKSIEESLKMQQDDLDRFSKTLPPPSAEVLHLDLSRSSPFGPLSQVSSRRTFAYLIATLNASHPDYDFSHILRPADFRKERNLRSVIQTVDDTLHNLRPRPSGIFAASMHGCDSNTTVAGPQMPGGSQSWGPKMWELIDKEMSLRECELYRYCPEEDPFDSEESAIWSMGYFFFNKDRKRVCYVYLRGISIASQSSMHLPATAQPGTKRPRVISSCNIRSFSPGSFKRAKYWLGNHVARQVEEFSHDDDMGNHTIVQPGDDEVDADEIDIDGALSDATAKASMESEEEDELYESIDNMNSSKGSAMKLWKPCKT